MPLYIVDYHTHRPWTWHVGCSREVAWHHIRQHFARCHPVDPEVVPCPCGRADVVVCGCGLALLVIADSHAYCRHVNDLRDLTWVEGQDQPVNWFDRRGQQR